MTALRCAAPNARLLGPLEHVSKRHFPPRHHIAAIEHVAFGENENIVGSAVHRCGALVGVDHNDHLRPRPQPVGHFLFYLAIAIIGRNDFNGRDRVRRGKNRVLSAVASARSRAHKADVGSTDRIGRGVNDEAGPGRIGFAQAISCNKCSETATDLCGNASVLSVGEFHLAQFALYES